MPYIPHTQEEIETMLATIGVGSIEALFDEIPDALRCAPLTQLPPQLTELEIGQLMRQRANQDGNALCFIGAGAYEHHIPAAVWEIATRGEFYSAYTPYQAEASQGTLQLLYEYQTMMTRLTGMDVSNASLYDGASALAEAVLMAVRLNKSAKANTVLLPATVHPIYRQVVETLVKNQGIQLKMLPYHPKTGTVDLEKLPSVTENMAALVIPQPNFFGMLEAVNALTDWAKANKLLVIAQVNPTTLSILSSPDTWGEQGADIVCGEGQPLGIPLASGGPYFGFLCCKQDYVRQMPGRIIGRTTDLDGKEGFVLTLQAREQHIRRSKATSNICTNQGLMVTAATIYLSIMGAEGLERTALACHANTHQLIQRLSQIDGVTSVFKGDYFHEHLLQLNKPVAEVLTALAQQRIWGGYDVSRYYPELGNALLVCATETRTAEDIEFFAKTLTQVLAN
ncbi:glycine cleavage system protein P [Beggiatoa alba B18LD]|uniref:Probable glycine dehydrogenase (decarboxylating) subunit 1 n=1 Tax=Beggiatoa alba B18LD TaxID=395493 RepID=I3CCC3_9GAMM|nr:aminomethyl-transferring glycine dehydrogenase subunit GcvPA [Beggiatoa alba]EIJ41266.1 glycine cleavage system protein P [Beggiatoa alba B18LD]